MTREEIKDFCDMKASLEPENEDIYKAIVKALEQESKWIPVTERLPDEEGFYLVTRRITDDVATFIFRCTPTSKDYWKRCATAWMPKPQPYKAESEEI